MVHGAELSVGIVIPALNEAARIGALVSSLAKAGFAEIILADGGSTDRTQELARAAAPVSIASVPGSRGAQINAAVATAHSDVLVLLHADAELPHGALALVRAALPDPYAAA